MYVAFRKGCRVACPGFCLGRCRPSRNCPGSTGLARALHVAEPGCCVPRATSSNPRQPTITLARALQRVRAPVLFSKLSQATAQRGLGAIVGDDDNHRERSVFRR